MAELKTVGELKKWLADNNVSDDTEIWLGATEIEGGLDYFMGNCKKYDIEVVLEEQTFGIALPKERQITKKGLVIY